MLFPAALVLPLLVLIISPVLSAPIFIAGGSRDAMTAHPVHAGLEKRSPLFWGHHHTSDSVTHAKLTIPVSSPPVIHDDHSGMLVKRSFDDMSNNLLAKRIEGTTIVTLVKRKSIFTKMKEGLKKLGKKIKSGFKSFAKKAKAGFKKMGEGIKKVAKKIKKGVQKAFKAVKNGVVKAAKKVAKFVKTTGAKIAKFGLKIYATATKLASKVIGLVVPGVGKAIGRVLDGASRVANLVSDKIHVSLGKKLDKGMKVLDRIQHPFKGVAGKAFDALTKRELGDEELFKRDMLEVEALVERDFPELDTRSFDDHGVFERDLTGLEVRSFEKLPRREVRSIFRKDYA